MDTPAGWIATALTAVASIGAVAIALTKYVRSTRPPLPVIELEFTWAHESLGHYLVLDIVIRNQLYETIALESMRIRNPRGMTFSREVPHPPVEKPWRGMREVRYERTDESLAELDWEIAPLGQVSRQLGGGGSYREEMMRDDVFRRSIWLSPPQKWDGGIVALELRPLSRALTIRPRKIVVSRVVDACTENLRT